MTLLLFGSFFMLLLFGVPIAISLGLSSVVTMIVFEMPLAAFPSIIFSGTGKFALLAIPFFVLSGVIMEYAGISKRLVRFASVMVGHRRGGLAVVTIIVSAFFAAISGSGPATVAALGPILIPAMIAKGYKKDWAAALVANSGNMGIIIPPSIILVIYGVLAEVSIVKLFTGGFIPGILFAVALIAVSSFSLRKQKNEIQMIEKATGKEKLSALKDALWGLMSPVIILGGIYGGVFTPTESAAVSAVYGLFVGIFVYKEIKLKKLWKVLLDASVSSASVMFIIATASLFSWILTSSNMAAEMAKGLLSISSNRYVILFLINILMLIAGMFVDSGSALYIFVPILLPVLRALNFDLVAFGVILTVNLAIGMSTPPVGVDLFVACNVSGASLSGISKQTFRFVAASLVVLFLITFVPEIIMFLPNLIL